MFGGSQGARAINEAMVAALPKLKEVPAELRIKHQTGAADFKKVNAAYLAAGWNERAEVRSYINNMMADFAAADLVLVRGRNDDGRTDSCGQGFESWCRSLCRRRSSAKERGGVTGCRRCADDFAAGLTHERLGSRN